MAIDKSYTFANNTLADPTEVNQNFDDMIAAIRAAHHRDLDGSPIEPADIKTGWGLVPSGAIMFWSGLISAIPAGYVFCNGSNGTPDMRNKFALCAGQDSGGTYDTGDTGGEETHVLTVDEMPVHTHVQNEHSHPAASGSFIYSSGLTIDANSGGNPRPQGTSASTGNATATNKNAGSGNAHNNMPPFKVLVFMQKT